MSYCAVERGGELGNGPWGGGGLTRGSVYRWGEERGEGEGEKGRKEKSLWRRGLVKGLLRGRGLLRLERSYLNLSSGGRQKGRGIKMGLETRRGKVAGGSLSLWGKSRMN